jgi:hypothetical protein
VGGVVLDTVFECLEHHVVVFLDLAVAQWVGDRGVVDVDEVILAKVPEDRASEDVTSDFTRKTECISRVRQDQFTHT